MEWYSPTEKIPAMTKIRTFRRNRFLIHESDPLMIKFHNHQIIEGRAVVTFGYDSRISEYGAGEYVFESCEGKEIDTALILAWGYKNDNEGRTTEENK